LKSLALSASRRTFAQNLYFMIKENEYNIPLWQLTVGQFLEILEKWISPATKEEAPIEHRYVKGIDGIASLFGCSRPTALKLKKTIIQEAVTQNGRVILTDADMAIELFRKYQEENGILAKLPSK